MFLLASGTDGIVTGHEGRTDVGHGDVGVRGAGSEGDWLLSIHARYGSEMVTVMDERGVPRYESPAIERVLGYKPIERFGGGPAGGAWTDLIHPDDVAKMTAAVAGSLAAPGEHPPVEYRIRDAGGHWRWFESRAINLRDDPEISGIMVSSREVTDRRVAEERFRSAFEDSPIGVAFVGLDRRYLRVNRTLREMLGYTEEQMLERTAVEVTHPEDLTDGPDRIDQTLEEGAGTVALEKRLLRSDGQEIWVLTSISLVMGPREEPAHFVALYQDITDRKRAEEALAESERRLRAVAEGAPVILLSVDREGRITFDTGGRLTAPGPTAGRRVNEVYADYPQILEGVRRTLAGEEVAGTVELDGPDGRLYFDVRYSPLRDEHGAVEGAVGVATDVTERKRLERELAHRATHDPLTGLPNRTFLVERLSHALERARRGDEAPTVLFMDLDGFKSINDSLGHEVGDRLLVEVAGRLQETLRPTDTVCRMGGDEFVILLEGTDARGAARASERILAALAEPFEVRGPGVALTASIGIAGGTENGAAPEELLRAADRAMYEAKAAGKAGYRGAS